MKLSEFDRQIDYLECSECGARVASADSACPCGCGGYAEPIYTDGSTPDDACYPDAEGDRGGPRGTW